MESDGGWPRFQRGLLEQYLKEAGNKMRDIVFKNLTSEDKRHKRIASSELIEQGGLRTNVYRHLICEVSDVKEASDVLSRPVLYVLKKRNNKSRTEFFYCRIKGHMYLAINDKVRLVTFIHSLRIYLQPASAVAKHQEK